MKRFRLILADAGETFRWIWCYFARTAPADRFGLVPSRIIKAPMCWVRGHDWADRHGAICITNWTLQYCQCCGQEIAGRTGFHQIISRPDDLDWWDEHGRFDDDDDPSPADWDEAMDRAVANGGPF